jgi:hypothetical protein
MGIVTPIWRSMRVASMPPSMGMLPSMKSTSYGDGNRWSPLRCASCHALNSSTASRPFSTPLHSAFILRSNTSSSFRLGTESSATSTRSSRGPGTAATTAPAAATDAAAPTRPSTEVEAACTGPGALRGDVESVMGLRGTRGDSGVGEGEVGEDDDVCAASSCATDSSGERTVMWRPSSPPPA